MATKKTSPKHSAVMLIDDNEIDNFINQKMIEGCDFSNRIYVHTSSKSALEFLTNLTAKDIPKELIPTVIFLDINMPIMDGFQFIEEFEKFHEDMKKYIRIIILTSSMDPIDLEKSRKYGLVQKFINKPLSMDSLDSI